MSSLASGVTSCFGVNPILFPIIDVLLTDFQPVLLQMSFAEDLPDMDGTDLLGLFFQGEENGLVEPLFPVENGLIESWLSEQDVSICLGCRVSAFVYTLIQLLWLGHINRKNRQNLSSHDYLTGFVVLEPNQFLLPARC